MSNSPMRTQCPACGKEVGALKNHVRLSSGNGHGPAGQVPDDLDPGTTNNTTQSNSSQQMANQPTDPNGNQGNRDNQQMSSGNRSAVNQGQSQAGGSPGGDQNGGPLRARDIEIKLTNDMFRGEPFTEGVGTMTVRDAIHMCLDAAWTGELEDRVEELETDLEEMDRALMVMVQDRCPECGEPGITKSGLLGNNAGRCVNDECGFSLRPEDDRKAPE